MHVAKVAETRFDEGLTSNTIQTVVHPLQMLMTNGIVAAHGLAKGTMTLVDLERSAAVYESMPAPDAGSRLRWLYRASEAWETGAEQGSGGPRRTWGQNRIWRAWRDGELDV